MTRSHPMRWAALAAFLTIHCNGSLGRRTSTVITADGMHSKAVDSYRGCDGPVTRQEHSQQGGSIAVVHQDKGGAVFGGRVRMLSGRLSGYRVDGQRVTPPRSDRYQIWSVGAQGGYHSRWVGSQFGLGVIIDDDPWFIPWLRVLGGDLNAAWAELELGSEDPLLYTNIIGLGAGTQIEAVRGRLGMTLFGRPFRGQRFYDEPDPSRPGSELFLAVTDHLDGGFYFELGVLAGQFGLLGGGVIGEESWAGRLGISYKLE